MPTIIFADQGRKKEYKQVQIDGETGWVVATQAGREKWFPPHRIATVKFDRWETDD